ncbi:MAG: TIM-barrel domain-containing protein [Polyangiaceae bacterium]
MLVGALALFSACSSENEGAAPPADASVDRVRRDVRAADADSADLETGTDVAAETGRGEDAPRDAGVETSDAREDGADATTDRDASLDSVDVTTDGEVPDRSGDAPGTPIDVDRICDANLTLQITVLEDRALRLHYVRKGTLQTERGWVVDRKGFKGPTSITVSDTPARLSITTAALVVEVSGASCTIAVRDRAGAALWQESTPFQADPSGTVSLGRKLDDGERIYGLGEKTGVSNRRGRSFEMWNSDPAWTDPTGQYRTVSDPIYHSHPFFLSMQKGGRATGAFLANTYRTGFDVGKTTPDSLAMTATAGDVDLYFFDGVSPSDVVERYTRLVGRPFLPPLWALGYHQSRWSYTPAARVEEIAAELRTRSLPADGLWLDIDYMDGYRDFTWNPTTFPDPAGLFARLAGRGFKVTAILDPGVKSDPGGQYRAYNAGIADKHFILGSDQNPVVREVWPGASVFPDFTSARTRTWWGDLVGEWTSSGLRGVWIDMNEPAVFTKDGFPLDARVDGEGTASTFAEAKNVYALLMAQATHDGLSRAKPQQRPFVLTRAGFSGVQRYAAVWTGDALSTWDHLAMTPSMLAGMSVSGLSFIGSDIGGFSGSPPPELYGRWFELGSLSPFFRSHVATGTPNQEPWSFGPEVEGVARRMLALRYALLPYWYGAAVVASRTGAPIVRPVWFEFPNDEGSYARDDEFFIGSSLLAAPVTAANVTARDVYLPPGTFYDFYTGAAYQGPATINVPAPLGRIPIFVRAGAVMPAQDVIDYVGAPSNGKKYLDVFPANAGSTASIDLYEDDGETTAFASGAFATTAVSTSVTTSGLTIDVAAPKGSFTTPSTALVARVHGVASAPTALRIDGVSATPAYDVGTRVVTIPLGAPNAAHAIVLEYDTRTPPAPRQVKLDVTLALPASTPAGDIHIGTSALAWKPDGFKLTRNGNTASGQLTVLEGTLVKWKVTRGAWANVEVTATCGDLTNREIVADFGSNGTTSVQATVAAWVDRCP